MFAFSTKKNEVFKTVVNLKNEKDVAIDFVSAEAFKTVLPLNVYF